MNCNNKLFIFCLGPAAYLPKKDPCPIAQTTIAVRRDEPIRSITPGPKYNLQQHKPGKSSPGYKMGVKYPDWLDPMPD